jgi:hypothetical protein
MVASCTPYATPRPTSSGCPKNEAALPEWQAAIEALMLVVERDGPAMFARVGVMLALNRGLMGYSRPYRFLR